MLVRSVIASAALTSAALIATPAAQAQDFFSLFNNAFGGGRSEARRPALPFAPAFPSEDQPRREASYTSSSGYCVRTCDGRYFPLAATGNQSKAQACNSFCPASETKVVYGSSIDNAVTDGGKPYSELPNAFKYRTELVSGCTCNGKDSAGLAQVKVEDDKTLRRGDLVAGPNGLMVTGRTTREGGKSASFSPASKDMRARFSSLPVVAAE